ncbi:ATP-binding cassette domain-containing protein [Streptomyces tropicalis]|uniref:ATP-binding cassette domain-containing protein n=1 Tax=Streptomyces tropicalis TaxID=3034234 RepID=A0ABT5ZXM6_9ACTN|nr:ATP-binding cassette domain-containing protein [Streptomyces tropicalis]MDF3297113.1 ATP-binding cassette domain-containing protein [Streptomyces tropicalis]
MDGSQDNPRDTAHGLGITARDFGLRGPRGHAFRGVRLDAEPGALIAVAGPSGSGRTCLLLALTGRMKPTEGVAEVGGFAPPRQMAALRRVSALANVAGVTDLDQALTVGEHLRERALLQRRFGDSVRGLLRPRTERRAEAKLLVDTALASAGLDPETLPKGLRTAVRDLERPEALRLSVALALMARPRLLAVDDADFKLSDDERAAVWDLLRTLAASGTTVVAACSEAPADAVRVSTAPAADAGAGNAGGTTGEENAEDAAGERAAGGAGGAGADRPPADTAASGGAPRTGTADDDEGKGAADALAETGRA